MPTKKTTTKKKSEREKIIKDGRAKAAAEMKKQGLVLDKEKSIHIKADFYKDKEGNKGATQVEAHLKCQTPDLVRVVSEVLKHNGINSPDEYKAAVMACKFQDMISGCNREDVVEVINELVK